MQDRPTKNQLLEATAQFLSDEIIPLVANNPRLRFRTLIAINVLSIIEREIKAEGSLLQAEWQRLTALNGQPQNPAPCHPQELEEAVESLNRQLCSRIRQGEADNTEWAAGVVKHLEATLVEKLQISNPRFLEQTSNQTRIGG